MVLSVREQPDTSSQSSSSFPIPSVLDKRQEKMGSRTTSTTERSHTESTEVTTNSCQAETNVEYNHGGPLEDMPRTTPIDDGDEMKSKQAKQQQQQQNVQKPRRMGQRLSYLRGSISPKRKSASMTTTTTTMETSKHENQVTATTTTSAQVRDSTRRSSLRFLRRKSSQTHNNTTEESGTESPRRRRSLSLRGRRSQNRPRVSKTTSDKYENNKNNNDRNDGSDHMEKPEPPLMERTRVIPRISFPSNKNKRNSKNKQNGRPTSSQSKLESESEQKNKTNNEDPTGETENSSNQTNSGGNTAVTTLTSEYSPHFECATAILQHSYLERICGVGYDDEHDVGVSGKDIDDRDGGDTTNNNGNTSIEIDEGRGRYHSSSNVSSNRTGQGHTNRHASSSSSSSLWQHRGGIISEDPTVQESIECIFASQLRDGIDLWDSDEEEIIDDDYDHNDTTGDSGGVTGLNQRVASRSLLNRGVSSSSSSASGHLVSPAGVQQSRLNRNDRKGSSSFSMKQTKKRYEQASLVYVGTFDPTMQSEDNKNNISRDDTVQDDDGGTADAHATDGASNLPSDPLPCHCATSFLPSVHPKNWPQAPLLLRPTPGSGTRIKCIRYSKDTPNEPLWVPGSHLSWSERIAKKWGKPIPEQPHYACCERCAILPINNGNEEIGKSLVIDFESDLFEGTFFLRLRHSNGTTPEPYDDSKGYFKGVNRRYQACVRGRFKKSIPLVETVTGFRFERKCGKLPAKWILRGGLKVVSFFAPQLDAKLEGDHPHSLTPLGSTPQSISVDNHADESDLNMLDEKREEPVEAHRTLLGESFSAPTSLQRAKLRKKAFDKLFVQQNQSYQTDPSKVYTFEFLQHLFNFQDFSVELGSMLGSVYLEDVLDGQPLQIMAAHGDKPIWSFDVWHECLWEKARLQEEKSAADNTKH